LVGLSLGKADIAVLGLETLLPTGNTALATGGNKSLFLSMDVYFLGFPYGLQTDLTTSMSAGYPIPLVKKAIISGFDFGDQRYTHCLLDGHNNPGFSGGPVVAKPPGEEVIRVIGVISGYKSAAEPVLHQGQATPMAVMYNTGIIDTYSIEVALQIISSNPIGCPIA